MTTKAKPGKAKSFFAMTVPELLECAQSINEDLFVANAKYDGSNPSDLLTALNRLGVIYGCIAQHYRDAADEMIARHNPGLPPLPRARKELR